MFFILIFFIFPQVYSGSFSVDYTNHQFIKDGQPFQYISGSIHYFRVHPDQWDDRLKRIRALGLNAIQTYAPWNLHEPTPGNFDFSGLVNLTRFLTLAQQNELYVLFRPGPYIDAEWDNGGLPYWLLKNDNINLRSSDPNFINPMQSYFNVLLEVLKPFLYKNGGPILMLQVENEYGILGSCDRNYTLFSRDLMWDKFGDDVVLYTTDNPIDTRLNCGKVPGTVTTVDFSPINDSDIAYFFSVQDAHSGGAPHVCSEFYGDWFLTWGEKSGNSRSVSQYVDNLSYMHSKKNGSVNIYLVHGGTNFDFYNGAESYAPIITSYWINSPITENGNVNEMYHGIWNFINNLTNWEQKPLPIPTDNPASNYGQVTMNRIGNNLISTLTQIQEPCSLGKDPISFELVDHPFGYVLYSTTVTARATTLSAPNIKDYGYIFINNNYQGMLSKDANITTLQLTNLAQQGDTLRILVENRGRRSGWSNVKYPVHDTKGLFGNVTLDGVVLQNWYTCGINLTKGSIDSLLNSFYEEHLDGKHVEASTSQPGVFIGRFTADVIQDTYLDTTGWGKGQVFINGYNMGRYWPTAGPQITLYIPKPFIQQNNSVLLIELTGAQQNYVNFINHSIFVYK